MKERKRVWITGATGFIGRALIADWKSSRPDLDLALFVRDPKGIQTEIVRVFQPSLGSEFSLEDLQRSRDTFPPDLIVHLATRFQNAYSPSDAEAMLDANLRFPLRILEACRNQSELRFLNFGTFYSHVKENLDSPATFYAATKRSYESFLEFYCSRPGWRATTLKLFDSYGPGDGRPKLIPKWIESLRTQEEMALTPGEQKLNLLYVDDIVAATSIAADRLFAGECSGHTIYQLSTTPNPEELPSLREVAKIFETAAGHSLPLRFGALPYRENEIMVPRMSFPILPGWKPKTNLLEGFRKTLASHQKGKI